jgi:hypothetical protein
MISHVCAATTGVCSGGTVIFGYEDGRNGSALVLSWRDCASAVFSAIVFSSYLQRRPRRAFNAPRAARTGPTRRASQRATM